MMAVIIFLLLCVLQFITGFGLITCCRVNLKAALLLPLAMLSGVAIFSCVPFILQLCYIPLTGFSVFSALTLASILLNMPLKKTIQKYKQAFTAARFKIRLYEAPFLLVIAVIVFVSVWRCFYFPPTPRDLTSGAEAIAEYAVHEKTMINSVFTVNMESTNNPFKPPFVASLQIIYKLAGFPFGQLWLSAIFISFIIFLYHALNTNLHRVISGLLLICFIAIPEMFAYTFMVLFDYSNAVYFFLGTYFLISYFQNKHLPHLVLAGMLMGIATYARNETLVLACIITPAILLNGFKHKARIIAILSRIVVFLLPSILCYIICVSIYLNHYLPVKYDVSGQVNPHLADLAPLITRFKDINTVLIFSSDGITYYAYFIFIFLALFITEAVLRRHFSAAAKNWLYAVLVVYAGLAILGYLLPLMDLDNTTKRGLFKVFSLMLLYMANNGVLIRLSDRITGWEQAPVVIS